MFNLSIRVNHLQDNTYGINNLEIQDGIFGKLIADMNGNEIEDVRNELIHLRKKIVLCTTDMPVTDKEKYIRFFRHAHLLYIENVEVSLAGIGGPENFEALAEIIDMARGMGMTLCLQPTEKFDFLEVYKDLRTPATGLIFDTIAYLKRGIMPFMHVMYKCKVKDDMRFLRIRDGLMNTGEPVPLEEGNAEIKECVSNLLVRSFRGYFSITDFSGDIPSVLDGLEKIFREL